MYVCQRRVDLTLHTKCRHPDAIRSGAYRLLDNEPSITDVDCGQLRCADCGCMFDKAGDLIVHSWTHRVEHKSLKEEEQNAISRETEVNEKGTKGMIGGKENTQEGKAGNTI